MSNPFSRPQAGAYKPYLVKALQNVGRATEAKEFETGSMKLAIVETITGAVRTFHQLNAVCVDALSTLEKDETISYYAWGLSNGQFVVASSNGAYVYDPTDMAAVNYVNEQLEISGNEVIQPFFSK